MIAVRPARRASVIVANAVFVPPIGTPVRFLTAEGSGALAILALRGWMTFLLLVTLLVLWCNRQAVLTADSFAHPRLRLPLSPPARHGIAWSHPDGAARFGDRHRRTRRDTQNPPPQAAHWQSARWCVSVRDKVDQPALHVGPVAGQPRAQGGKTGRTATLRFTFGGGVGLCRQLPEKTPWWVFGRVYSVSGGRCNLGARVGFRSGWLDRRSGERGVRTSGTPGCDRRANIALASLARRSSASICAVSR